MSDLAQLQGVVRKAFLATVPRRHADEIPDGYTHCVVPDALVHTCSHDEHCCAHTVYDVCRFAGPNTWEALCAVVIADSVAEERDDFVERAKECQEFAQTITDLFAALPALDRLLSGDLPDRLIATFLTHARVGDYDHDQIAAAMRSVLVGEVP